jgi:hypothetical protein
MGKTVPAYRWALEDEIRRWKPFVKSLSEQDREIFEVLMNACRNNSMASSNACKPVIFEPMVMAILVFQQKKIKALEARLNLCAP